ncbi:response regulator [Chrysosporum bergii ANA360D]|uniref:histidine kinase n=1 Tax=Chrysosporum bergii ANA360D TaxID=617107 RepID=A0AA43GTS4_9CYAN|nr:response regulator [Chrysosporum bergii]MDH6061459.1 response regulator [Chrysosporum bergii ANA360D]
MLQEQQQRILGYFIEEARDHLNTIEQGLLNLESTLKDPEMINEVFRAAHSIKGGAAMLGLDSIQRTSHRLEDCFKVLKENPVQVDQQLESLFLGVSDTLKVLLEHLSGPLGLSQEAANTLMLETEPVFKWLNEHLELLVEQNRSGVATRNTTTQAELNEQDTFSTLTELFLRTDISHWEQEKENTSVKLTENSLPALTHQNWDEFKTDVLQTLREMLQLFKTNTTPESRQNLQQCCQKLVKLGQKRNLPHWCKLCQAAANAISNPENNYLSLAKIVITEIKQAQELVIQGQETSIGISQQLAGFLPADYLYPLTADEELPSTTDNFASQTDIQPIDSITSLSQLSDQLHPTEDTSAFGEIFSLGQEEEVDISNNDLYSNTPLVGLSELNTLADLFADEMPELDQHWEQQEVLNVSAASELEINVSKPNVDDIDSDFDDLLSATSNANSRDIPLDNYREAQASTLESQSLSLDDLFDDFADLEEQPHLSNHDSEISDLFDITPTQIIEFTQAEEDFWNQESITAEQGEVVPVVDQDVAKALEESLLASVGGDACSNIEEYIPTLTTSVNRENDDADDLFADLAASNFLLSIDDNDENLTLQKMSSFSQEPETLDVTPEFTKESSKTDSLDQNSPIILNEDITSRDNLTYLQSHEDDQLLVLDTDTSTLDEFAELEAILDRQIVVGSDASSLPEDDFAELEALLNRTGLNQLTQPSYAPEFESIINQTADYTITSSDVDDEFSDLEKLLAQADKTISQSSPTQPRANTSKISPSSDRYTARFEETMKVPVKQLDEMSNLVGELVVNRNTLEQDYERLRQSLDNLLIQVQHLSDVGARMQELYERSLLEASLLASRKTKEPQGHLTTDQNNDDSHTDRGFSELEMDRFTPFHTLSQEMIEFIVRVRESASDIDFVTEETETVARQFRQVTNQLQEGLTRARMVPFSQTIDRLRRGVRDNAIKYGKQVELVISGGDVLIDKMILDHLTDPFTHMLNNAIAHGIETPEIREKRGKPRVGKITIRAFHQGNQTVISVGDDGAGIDPERIKAKAMQMGMITPAQAKSISHKEIYDLLFRPGFSIKDKADEIAGRGVGMDIVRSAISEIRGTVSTDSAVRKGTTFTIRLPLTLSICKALCCVSDKGRIAFPMDGVEDTLDIPVTSIQYNQDGQSYISWRDTVLPLRPLRELLTLNRQLSRGNVYGGNRDDDMISVVVVRSGNTLIGLQIDMVLSEQEIVIKQFEPPAPKPIGVAGATILGDGHIMPIADVLEIIDIFHGRISKQNSSNLWLQPETVEKVDPTVLIVDDSITVRELLSLTFNKAGYRVEQARDGQEAWEKLRSGLPCDIVFCDIEMPRCDGLELLSRIQKDANLNHLPIAMLTSRGADKHRQMAIQLGASGYFTKPYLEEVLLEAAVRMLTGEKLVSS